MNKKIEFLLSEIGKTEKDIVQIVVASSTKLLPKKNVSAFSEYSVVVETDAAVFYFVKSKGLFNKEYSIKDTVHLIYKDIEHAEFGKNGQFYYLQLVIDGELNALICKKDPNFAKLVENIGKQKELVDYEIYEKLLNSKKTIFNHQ